MFTDRAFFLKGINDHGSASPSIPHRLYVLFLMFAWVACIVKRKLAWLFGCAHATDMVLFWKKCGLTTNWPPMCLHMFALWKTQKSWDLFEVIYFQTKPDTNAIDPSRCERRFAHAQCTGNPRLQLRSILILFWAEPCAMVKIGTCPPARDSHSPYKHREEGF